MRLFEGIRAVAFDFDGVLVVDSDAVFKEEAWKKALSGYRGYEPHLEESRTLFGHGKKGGRKEMVRHILSRVGVAGEDLEAHASEADKIFDAHVRDRILDAGLAPGARETLMALKARGISAYLNSGTATYALKATALLLGIENLLRDSLGSTSEPIGGSKAENLRHIARQEGIPTSAVLMVGDQDSDRMAAEAVRAPFLGVSNQWNGWKPGEGPFSVVRGLGEIPDRIA